jgi:hypothetical protein
MLSLQIALGILLAPVLVVVGASIIGLCRRLWDVLWDTGTMIPIIATIYAIGVFLYWAVTHGS